ncbi:MAG TPA: type II CRISPR-associated endonuclease Cas1 [Phycisphaerales bacterium]|nr:type II CRISPR-associated endonuclease Cas1 [Phycisphaerales bacterium]
MPAGDRVIEIARAPAKVSLRHGCIIVSREDGAGGRVDEASTPVREVGVLILAHPQAIATTPALHALMAEGATVLVCDAACLPAGLMLPLRANALQTQRMLAQVVAKAPVKKRLWRQIVKAKIMAQAGTLAGLHDDDGGLPALADRVRSGDPMNVEATAAQRYWPLLFRDAEFRRRFDAEDQNRLLNYGYAILRAAMGRAVCAAGLHPSLGLHHKSRENPWCLCDDLMEPYRPLVDFEVARMAAERGRDCPLDPASKHRLMEVLATRVNVDRKATDTRQVSDLVHRTANSLTRVFAGESSALEYPHGLFTW